MLPHPKEGARREVGETKTVLGQLSRQADQSGEGWGGRGLLQASEVQVRGDPGRPWCTPSSGCFVLFGGES